MPKPSLVSHFSGKRFLFIIGQYTNLGGAERQAIILADYLKNKVGCEVSFLAWGGEGRVTEELNQREIKHSVFSLNWNSGAIGRIQTLYKLGKCIKNEMRPDYLLPYIGFNCKIIGLVWRRTGAKYTWWNQRDEGRDVFGSHVEKYVMNTVSDVVSNSFEGRDFLTRTFGLSSDEIKVINNGIELPAPVNRRVWRDKLGLEKNDILITMVAHITKNKDHETLIKAFGMLHSTATGKSCHLMLVGILYDNTNFLKALAFDLGLSGHVHFVGGVRAVSECYAASDLAVHCSYKEGCPNAVLEAMAHSLPVCGTDISGMRQALGEDGSTGVLASIKDHESLSHVMENLIADKKFRTNCGKNNLQRIQEFYCKEKLAEHVLSLISNHEERR